MARTTYKQVRRSAATFSFGMDSVRFLNFNEKQRFLLTEDLNGCFAVFLVSPTAVIGAHISPNPGTNRADPHAGDRNLRNMMVKVRDVFKTHQGHFTHPRACLIFATFPGKVALPDKKHFIEQCLQRLDMKFTVQDYHVRSPGEHRREEQGTAFVDGGDATGPTVYLEDRVVLIVSRQAPNLAQGGGRPESRRHRADDDDHDDTDPRLQRSQRGDPSALFPPGPTSGRHGADDDDNGDTNLHLQRSRRGNPSALFPRGATSGRHGADDNDKDDTDPRLQKSQCGNPSTLLPQGSTSGRNRHSEQNDTSGAHRSPEAVDSHSQRHSTEMSSSPTTERGSIRYVPSRLVGNHVYVVINNDELPAIAQEWETKTKDDGRRILVNMRRGWWTNMPK